MSGSYSSPPGSFPCELGPYEPLFVLASGGMATLFLARQRGTAGVERLVAVKRVHPHLLDKEEFRSMFLDEARLASLIHHPNVVHVLSVDEVDGELLLGLEYVEGVSFSRLLSAAQASGTRLPLPVISRIVCDMLAGLHAAHEAVDVRGRPLGIVHRDVSPQNVIVGLDGVSRLIDFGIARAADRITTTDDGVIKGKAAYLSPEVLLGKPLDARADIFAAGLLLREALTGEVPFQGTVGMYQRVFDPVPPIPSQLGIPEQVNLVIEKATQRERDERYQSASEFHEALESLIAPAPSREVSKSIQELCGDEIIRRRVDVQEALNVTTRIDQPARLSRPAPRMSMSPVEKVYLPSQPSRRFTWMVGGAAAVAVGLGLLAVGVAATRSNARAPSLPTPTVPSSPSIAPSAAASASEPPVPVTEASTPTPVENLSAGLPNPPRTVPRGHPPAPPKTSASTPAQPPKDDPLHPNPYPTQ